MAVPISEAPTEVGAVTGYRSELCHWIVRLSQLKRLPQSCKETPKFTVIRSISLDIVITSSQVVDGNQSVGGAGVHHNSASSGSA